MAEPRLDTPAGHECPVCHRRFRKSCYLTVHMRIHSGMRPFVCATCGDAFTQGAHLRSHERVHTGARPYVCEVCSSAFVQSSHLLTHKRIHSGEKPYKCPQCDACFTQPHHLAGHIESLHTARGQQRMKRKEERVARFLESTGFHYDREVTIDFCSEGNQKRARVDFVVYRQYGVCIIEVDEGKHSQYPLECEVARMSNIFASQVKLGRTDMIKIIRYNPDTFREFGRPAHASASERLDRLLQAILAVPTKQFSIVYLFYDKSSLYPEVVLNPAFPRELRDLVEMQ